MNTFEQSLLTELRQHVAARSTAARPRSRRWRWAAVPVAGAALAGAVALALQPGPAYAVSDSGDDIVITIHRLDDADGLEKALAQHGIEAEVDSPTDTVSVDPSPPADDPAAQGLSVGSDEPGSPTETMGSVDDDGVLTEAAGEPQLPAGDLRFGSNADGSLTLEIDREAIPADEVLHIVTSGAAGEGMGLAVWWGTAD